MTNNNIKYEPFVMSLSKLNAEHNMVNIPTSAKMEGSENNDLMIAAASGSQIFADYGLNYIQAAPGPDKLYFSICSTKIIDNKVSVVENFDPKQDKLVFFCMEHVLQENDFSIIHTIVNDQEVTYIDIFVHQDIHEHEDITAIALIGNIDIKVSDIILNEAWIFDQSSCIL